MLTAGVKEEVFALRWPGVVGVEHLEVIQLTPT
jgi:hypothetical protein